MSKSIKHIPHSIHIDKRQLFARCGNNYPTFSPNESRGTSVQRTVTRGGNKQTLSWVKKCWGFKYVWLHLCLSHCQNGVKFVIRRRSLVPIRLYLASQGALLYVASLRFSFLINCSMSIFRCLLFQKWFDSSSIYVLDWHLYISVFYFKSDLTLLLYMFLIDMFLKLSMALM